MKYKKKSLDIDFQNFGDRFRAFYWLIEPQTFFGKQLIEWSNLKKFWGKFNYMTKKLSRSKYASLTLSLQFVCYTKTFFSQTKNSLSFLFFRKRDAFTWMHQTAPKETVEGLWERPKNSGMWVPPQNSWCFSWRHWLWGTPLDTSALLNAPPPLKIVSRIFLGLSP